MDSITFANGRKMPLLGFGTWMIPDEATTQAVYTALRAGYRHIDTAQAYGNERGVGRGFRDSGLSREDVFITTKVAAEFKDPDSAYESIKDSLARLGMDYIDLILIHSPQPWAEFRGQKRYFEENRKVWKALERAYKEGLVKAIGVSNFLEDDLDNILSSCKVKPMVNQILCHVGNTPFGLIDYCHKQGIAVEAYSPIGHGEVLKDPTVIKMAESYGVSPARLCLRYDLQLGLAVLPKASSAKHIRDNAKLDFEITPEDMENLKGLVYKDYGEASYFPVFSGKGKIK